MPLHPVKYVHKFLRLFSLPRNSAKPYRWISASLGSSDQKWGNKGYSFGLFEPAGGSAPEIAGKNIANPIAQILSAAMMLKFSLKMEKESLIIENAVKSAIKAGALTADLIQDERHTSLSTTEMSDKIIEYI